MPAKNNRGSEEVNEAKHQWKSSLVATSTQPRFRGTYSEVSGDTSEPVRLFRLKNGRGPPGTRSYCLGWAEKRRIGWFWDHYRIMCKFMCAVVICRKWNSSNYQYFFLFSVCQQASKCLERSLKTRLTSAWSPITVTLMARLFWATPFDVSTPQESWFFSWQKRFWNQPGKNCYCYRLLIVYFHSTQDFVQIMYSYFV